MDPEKSGSIGQGNAHLKRQLSEPAEPTTCCDHPLRPGKCIGYLDERFKQMRIALRFLDTRGWSITVANVAIGVAANEASIRKGGKDLKRSYRFRPECNQVTKYPIGIRPSL